VQTDHIIGGIIVGFLAAGFWQKRLWTTLSWLFCRGFGVSVLVASCSGTSALTALAGVPSGFRGHRVPFTDPAPARRGASVSFFSQFTSQGLVNGRWIAGILGKTTILYSPALRRVNSIPQNDFHIQNSRPRLLACVAVGPTAAAACCSWLVAADTRTILLTSAEQR
jgi:hypothetical protein